MIKVVLGLIIILNIAGTAAFSQWSVTSQISANELGSYPSISVPNCSTIVVCGGATNSPRVFLSTNSGLNFANITGNITGAELYTIYALNKDTIFAGDGGNPGGTGGNAKVYKTTNGGMNWTVALTTGGGSGFISGITFSHTDPDFGIIVSDPAVNNDSFWVAKTHNRGRTWQITKAPNAAQFTTQNSVFAVDSLFYGFGLNTTPARFYMTTDGGISWIVRTIGLNGFSVPSIAFKSDKMTGIAISDIALPNIARTTNSGANWQPVNVGLNTSGVATVKWIPGTSIFFLAASNIRRSSDNGLSWYEMNTEGVSFFVHMDVFPTGANSICAYALASNGKVLKFEGEPFAVDPENSLIPVEFKLEQNYPNPFNPETRITYSVPKAGIVKLAVYDLNGKELRVITNRYHSIGNYSETLNLADLASGIYIYELSATDISISRKMTLIK